MSDLPFTRSSTGEAMVTVSWVEGELTSALGAVLSGRADDARRQISATLYTLEAITEALRSPSEASGGV